MVREKNFVGACCSLQDILLQNVEAVDVTTLTRFVGICALTRDANILKNACSILIRRTRKRPDEMNDLSQMSHLLLTKIQDQVVRVCVSSFWMTQKNGQDFYSIFVECIHRDLIKPKSYGYITETFLNAKYYLTSAELDKKISYFMFQIILFFLQHKQEYFARFWLFSAVRYAQKFNGDTQPLFDLAKIARPCKDRMCNGCFKIGRKYGKCSECRGAYYCSTRCQGRKHNCKDIKGMKL